MRLTVGNADFRKRSSPFDPTVGTGSDRLPFSTVAKGAASAPKGLWNNVLITTLSEFGRRLKMNGSNGPTTAPQNHTSFWAARSRADSTAPIPA